MSSTAWDVEEAERVSEKFLDDRVGHALALACQPYPASVIVQESLGNVSAHFRPDQRIQIMFGLLAEAPAVDAVGTSQLHGHSLARPLVRRQFFALNRWRLTRQDAANVLLGTASIWLALPHYVPSCTHSETKVRLICPVRFVMPAAEARPCEVRDLVMLESGCFESFRREQTQRTFQLLVDGPALPALALLPERRPLFVSQPISR